MIAIFQFLQGSILGSIMSQQVVAALGGAMGLVLIDFLLGILVALKQGSFDVRKLPQFLQTSIIPFVGSLLLLALFAGSSPELQGLFFACAAFVVVKFLADIKDKLGQIFTGIQFQSPVTVVEKINPVPVQPAPASSTELIPEVRPPDGQPVTSQVNG